MTVHDTVSAMASTTADRVPLWPPRVAVNLVVSVQALATFDALAAEHGLSRPKMFGRLMAVEAQKMRLAADVDRMRRDREAGVVDDPGVSEWVEANRIGEVG